MENAPVITVNGFSPYPGADPELWERFTKWGNEVYVPLMLKNPGRTGSDTYQITRQNPLYPFRLRIHHLTDLASQRRASVSAEQIAIQTDNNTWRTRNVMEVVWGGIYQLAFNFRGGSLVSSPKSDTRIENAPVLHLEAFRFSPEEQEKYNKWFTEYGQNIFIPLYFKQAGVKGFDCYENTGCKGSRRTFKPHFSIWRTARWMI
jgi:hypothetical protein